MNYTKKTKINQSFSNNGEIRSRWCFSKENQWGALVSLFFILIAIVVGIWAVIVDNKYQACLDKCEAQSCGLGAFAKGESCDGCKAGCREKYAK